MDTSQQILSEITIFSKYARFIPEISRRETWDELVERNMAMHIRKYPQLKAEIKKVFKDFVIPKKVLPSMRSLQFGGISIELSNARIYNCSYLPITHADAFSETMFLLLSGCGVGFSVRSHHISQLPIVAGPKPKTRRFLIGDSIEGWADSIKILVEAYFYGKSDPIFDYRDIRAKGARLVTSGGKAPGPGPLIICIEQIRSILNDAVGRKLTSLESHDIQCHIADAVLSGGIRRAAMISLFSKEDIDMLCCKSGAWWELNPQRGRANNSVALLRSDTTDEEFFDIWERIEESGAGEPGIFWANDNEMGTNPCCFVGDTPIQTDIGTMKIEDIVDKVNNGLEVKVLCLNEDTGENEYKLVDAGILTKRKAKVIELEIERSDGSIAHIRCTPDHRFLTKNRGWIPAISLLASDDLVEQNV